MKNLITSLAVGALSSATFATTWTVDDDGKADFTNSSSSSRCVIQWRCSCNQSWGVLRNANRHTRQVYHSECCVNSGWFSWLYIPQPLPVAGSVVFKCAIREQGVAVLDS